MAFILFMALWKRTCPCKGGIALFLFILNYITEAGPEITPHLEGSITFASVPLNPSSCHAIRFYNNILKLI